MTSATVAGASYDFPECFWRFETLSHTFRKDSIAAVGVSYIEIDTVVLDRFHVLQAVSKWHLQIVEEDGLYSVECGEIGLSVSTLTYGELSDAVHKTIAFLWRTYAAERDQNLTPKAIDLKTSLRNAFRKMPR